METSEFQEDVYYSGTVEDPARYRISLNDHKTAGVYGAAVVRLYDDLYKLIEMYLRTVRNQITTLDPKVKQVFVSSNRNVVLNVVTSVHFCLQNLPARRYSDKRKDMRNNSQIVNRKSHVTEMHARMPDEREHLAALAQHRTRTQVDYYRVHDKVSETDVGRRTVKKLVSLKTTETHAKEEKFTS